MRRILVALTACLALAGLSGCYGLVDTGGVEVVVSCSQTDYIDGTVVDTHAIGTQTVSITTRSPNWANPGATFPVQVDLAGFTAPTLAGAAPDTQLTVLLDASAPGLVIDPGSATPRPINGVAGFTVPIPATSPSVLTVGPLAVALAPQPGTSRVPVSLSFDGLDGWTNPTIPIHQPGSIAIAHYACSPTTPVALVTITPKGDHNYTGAPVAAGVLR